MPDDRDDNNEQNDKPENTPPINSRGKGGPAGGSPGSPGDGNMRFSRSMLGWILILSIAVLIFVEAASRFSSPPDVPGLPLILVAAVGLVITAVDRLVSLAGLSVLAGIVTVATRRRKQALAAVAPDEK